jgi:hypothetical protein
MGEQYITDFEGTVTLCGINSSGFEMGRFFDRCRQSNVLEQSASIKGRKSLYRLLICW